MIHVPQKLNVRNVAGRCCQWYSECSDNNGWIKQQLFLKWFEFPLARIPPARPVLLIEDSHTYHITIKLKLAWENDIHLFCLNRL